MLLLSSLAREKDFAPLLAALEKENKPVLVTGISSSLRSLLPAAVLHASGGKALILLPGEKEAAELAKALSSVFSRTYFFPARDFSLVRVDSSGRDFALRRLSVLSRLAKGDFDCIVTTYEAACQATISPDALAALSPSVSMGEEISKETLISYLLRAGYRECERVEGAGQFATRGDIIDVFLSGEDAPIRTELFGDEVDSIAYFDPLTQRREDNLRSFTVTPAQEICFSDEDLALCLEAVRGAMEKTRPEEKEKRVYLRDLADRLENGMDFAFDLFYPLIYPFSTLLDHFRRETVFLYEQSAGKEALDTAERFLQEELTRLFEENKTLLPPKETRLLESFDGLCAALCRRKTVLIENFFAGKSPIPPSGIFSFRTRTAAAAYRDMESLSQVLCDYRDEDWRTLVLCENSMAAETLYRFLEGRKIPSSVLDGTEEGTLGGVVGLLPRTAPGAALIFEGFELSDSKTVLLCDGTPAKAKERRRQSAFVKSDAKERLVTATDLAVGDYVVHSAHGIGVFRGVEKMKSADGSLKDFIKIAYAGSDVLYVPCSSLDCVSKYIGPKSDSADLKLHKLGGTEWHKAKRNAKKSAADIAKKLIALYAQRQKIRGHAFSADTTWQKEFEDAFPYGETDSQLRATREIKDDMEKPIPMDRLLCGDVGFGKTEVAIRGIFKCVMEGKQAAILVPTTILAWQHYQTLLARFKGYPVEIDYICRFRTKKEQTQILQRLKEGKIDILVGTHRLLQSDVSFRDLGFLVIDEEQRFGVTHKERLKEMSHGVDVLTLTATPIPRTLNMALGGIRDMSLLEEAPEDRFPVQTYVLEHDRTLIEDAIRRELRRGGQVFYLHNNIEELQARLPALARAFPDASIAVAHGRVDKDSLSDIWKDMMDHKIDILLCTTIIETGVDLPDANTLIVENADHFGLSQLHQIRGRVGRSDRKAYAFFTYRRGKVLSEISTKRLEALREYTRFGSGFSIALRDLELRGAGNLLGAEQSGHLDSIGYDMYMKLLSDAVLEEKGEKPKIDADCLVDLSLDGFIPESYVPYPAQRMELYRKIASLQTEEDACDLTDEMLDRFGDLPRSVQNLFAVALLRAKAKVAGCEKIAQSRGRIRFTFAEAKDEALVLLSAVYASRLTLSLTGKPSVILTLKEKEGPLAACDGLLTHLLGFQESLQNSNGKESET